MSKEYHISGITKSYGRKSVLSGVTFDVRSGECVGIAGTNGIGKSTLLKILAVADKPSGGSLNLLGHDLLKERRRFAELIAYVPQDNPLLEELTARDNLRLWSGKTMTGFEEEIRLLQIDEIIGTRVSRMSGGMKRRLAIACALTGNAPVLIMDEPTSALDLYHRDIIYRYLDSFRQRDGMIILSTHDVEEMRFADRLWLLHGGKAAETDPDEAASLIRSGCVD